MIKVASAQRTTEKPQGYDHLVRELPVLVLFPHNRCNCRCMMCDIWRLRQVKEISRDDLVPHLAAMRRLRVRWIVLSGGEPLMHSSLDSLCGALRSDGVRITLLTSGLLLKPRARLVARIVDDVMVSLDGPADIHDRIRNVPLAFQRLADGLEALRNFRADMPVSGRCTVQKANRNSLCETVKGAQYLRLSSISFLAADVTSQAFNRPQGWASERQQTIALDAAEVEELAAEIEALIRQHSAEISAGFVVESGEKLRRIASHFRAYLGQVPFAAPRCNAPWVSSVIESDGTVRPCFFHPPLGKLGDQPLDAILNSEAAIRFRRELDVSSDPVCRRCVCSLFLSQAKKEAMYRSFVAVESSTLQGCVE